jgi:hypothetical protein
MQSSSDNSPTVAAFAIPDELRIYLIVSQCTNSSAYIICSKCFSKRLFQMSITRDGQTVSDELVYLKHFDGIVQTKDETIISLRTRISITIGDHYHEFAHVPCKLCHIALNQTEHALTQYGKSRGKYVPENKFMFYSDPEKNFDICEQCVHANACDEQIKGKELSLRQIVFPHERGIFFSWESLFEGQQIYFLSKDHIITYPISGNLVCDICDKSFYDIYVKNDTFDTCTICNGFWKLIQSTSDDDTVMQATMDWYSHRKLDHLQKPDETIVDIEIGEYNYSIEPTEQIDLNEPNDWTHTENKSATVPIKILNETTDRTHTENKSTTVPIEISPEMTALLEKVDYASMTSLSSIPKKPLFDEAIDKLFAAEIDSVQMHNGSSISK